VPDGAAGDHLTRNKRHGVAIHAQRDDGYLSRL
jgi:hypothetical protein